MGSNDSSSDDRSSNSCFHTGEGGIILAIQIVVTVDKKAVQIENQRMFIYLNEVNRVEPHSTYKKLQDATMALNICRGMYEVLNNLGLTEENNFVGEDIIRVEAKIQNIYEEKRRIDMIRRHG